MARSTDDPVEDLPMEDLDENRVEWIDVELPAPRVTTVLGASERLFLRACCDGSAPAVLTWPEILRSRRARFARLDQGIVVFQLDDPPPTTAREPARCCVCFSFLDRTCAFIGFQSEPQPTDPPDQVTLRLPTQLAVEGRARLRIPVVANAGLRVTATVESESYQVRSLDINEAGMLIAFPTNEGPDLAVVQELSLTLELGDVVVSVPASVRRRVPRAGHTEYGLQFRKGAEGYASEHDQIIRELVVEIERFWARSEEL